MTRNIFQDIKDRVDLKDLVRFYGLEVDNKAYVEHCVDTLLFGSEQDKRNFYETDREYPKRIKKRLDELDAVSRKAPKRAI